jgi:hypothetical protein
LQQAGGVKRSFFGPEHRNFHSLVTVSALAVAAFSIVSCNRAPPEKNSGGTIVLASAPKPKPQPQPSTKPSASAAAAGDDLKITWKNPEKWVPTAAGSVMQKARYLTPPAEGDKEGATLTVFYFGPGMGGTVEANIDRWIGQFKNVVPTTIKKGERTKDKLTIHTVEVPEGVFEAGMMGGTPDQGPKPAWGMIGAVVEAPSGKYFFKLVGPKKTVATSKQDFDTLLESIQEKP